jgi:hypothetical protein
MRRALAALAAAALLAAGCGSDNPELIPQSNSDQLLAAVAQVEQACADGDVDAARQAIGEATEQVNELPSRTDRELRRNIRRWLRHIDGQLEQDCKAEETPEATETSTPEATETATAEPTETATAEPTETATAEPTETATASPTVSPDGDGGVPAPEEP